jgi:molybdenum cofactor cytidylyltransferase
VVQCTEKETLMADVTPAAALILAAGRSSRMGQHKLLLPVGGRPLVTYAVQAALCSRARPVIVVLGHNAAAVRAALPMPGLTFSTNPAFDQGMSTSLRAGIAAVPAECAGALVLLADQPLVPVGVLTRMLAAAQADPQAIVAASYAGQRATPVYFPRAYFPELARTTGDEGGRSVIAAHPAAVRLVESARPQTGLDVDRPGDYERLLAQWPRYSKLADA